MESLTAHPRPESMLQEFPPIGAVLFVTEFNEAREILSRPQLKPVRLGVGSRSVQVAIDPAGDVRIVDDAGDHQAEDERQTEPVSWSEFLRGGSLTDIHGAPHTKRRRALNPLVGRDAHRWLRDNAIMPILDRNLAQVLDNPGVDGIPRTDMVVFAMRVYIQLSAAVVGFDGAETDEGADALIGLQARLGAGMHFADVLRAGPELYEHMRGAIEARTELFERFYHPSLETRQRLVARHRAGEIADSDLPHDMLTLIAEDALPLDDPQDGLRQAMQLMQASSFTNKRVLLESLADLAAWFSLHPEDYALRTDPAFLEGALRDTMRLRGTGGAVLSRVALVDITLSSGKVIQAGQYVAFLRATINRDKSVFGPDADRFDPRRVVPTGISPFGVSFGGGPHMCLGLPLVMGQGGITGMQAPVLQALHAAGIRPDPARPAEKQVELRPTFDEYATFPVVFDPRG